ncbi:unnamed protein product, partial [Dicrocoelium dendriticum]
MLQAQLLKILHLFVIYKALKVHLPNTSVSVLDLVLACLVLMGMANQMDRCSASTSVSDNTLVSAKSSYY